MIRQQYGPNSLPDFSAPSAIQQLWGPPGYFNGEAKPGQQQRIHQAQYSSRRSFSTSSAPSSAFGSSNSLGSSAGNVAAPANWPWNDDLSLSPPYGQTTGCALNAAQLSFHNSLPTFNSHSAPVHYGRSTATSDDDAYHSAPMNCTEDEGEQLARSVARALEIDL